MSPSPMPLVSCGSLFIHQFESFSPDLLQAVFSRRGGVSPEPWNSLNLGGTVGDDLLRVQENKALAFAAMGRDLNTLFDVWQVHGVEIVIADAPLPPKSKHQQADGILTDKPGVTLLMRFADCVPILLHDPLKKVVGIVHAGWMGTVKGTVRYAVEAMQTHYHCVPADIQAGIGPSIGPDHYEVGPEVVSQVRDAFGKDASGLLREQAGRVFFDLWSANHLLLHQAGVRQVEVSQICTACCTADWYSHRAEKGRTGRFGAVIGLRA